MRPASDRTGYLSKVSFGLERPLLKANTGCASAGRSFVVCLDFREIFNDGISLLCFSLFIISRELMECHYC